jgi:hypothetical protein
LDQWEKWTEKNGEGKPIREITVLGGFQTISFKTAAQMQTINLVSP